MSPGQVVAEQDVCNLLHISVCHYSFSDGEIFRRLAWGDLLDAGYCTLETSVICWDFMLVLPFCILVTL